MDKKTPSELKKLTKAEIIEYAQALDADAIVTEFPEPQNVHEAINQLMGRVGYIQKQESDDLPYSFAGEAAFIKTVRPHMVDLGLTIAPTLIRHLETIQYQTKRGAQAFNRVFIITYQWTHTPSDTHYNVTVIGEGTDYGDKSCNKAMTVSLKYAVRQSLYMETGDDPDGFNSNEFERAQEQRTRETGLPTNGNDMRVDNQWEVDVVDTIVEAYGNEHDLARPHIVNILNNSIFRTTVPYGELTTPIALAYVIAWQTAKDKHVDDDTAARAVRVNANWHKIMEDFVEDAQHFLDDLEPAALEYND